MQHERYDAPGEEKKPAPLIASALRRLLDLARVSLEQTGTIIPPLWQAIDEQLDALVAVLPQDPPRWRR